MAIIRVKKTKNYTVMSNYHLKDKELSLKAKGLMCLMLSLPDNWDYTVEGLASICKENITAITSALKELKDSGYLVVEKKFPNQTNSGRIEYEYILFEEKQDLKKQDLKKQDLEKQGVEIQGVEIQGVEIQGVENQGQLNKDITITEGINTDLLNTEYIRKEKKQQQKHKYGEYGRVLLTDKELEKLKADYGEEFIMQAIDRLDEYIQSNNNKNRYTDFNLVLRKAIREQWGILQNIKGCVIIGDRKNGQGSILEHLKNKYNLRS